MIPVDARPEQYKQEHCWQYDIRLNNLKEDMLRDGISEEDLSNMSISDFEFSFVDKSNKVVFAEVVGFIERHEWLGKMSLYPTHLFVARYKHRIVPGSLSKNVLAGVIVMDMPASFSNLLGKDTRKIERLVSRGACISWSPKNLASSLLMYSIKWMVANTQYRLFTAYSDPEARELGTIYQACNFTYIGQNFGVGKKYRYPNTDRWISDRSFRSRSAYRRYAKALGIAWQDSWQLAGKDTIDWTKVPDDVEDALRAESKRQYQICDVRETPSKHKYCYILGRTKKETKILKKRFAELNPNLINLPYPKSR